MEFLTEYALFLAKAVTLIVGILVVVGAMVNASMRLRKAEKKGHIEVENLNEHYDGMKEALLLATQPQDEYKQHQKIEKKHKKDLEKSRKKAKKHTSNNEDDQDSDKKRIFVFDFHGDIKASEVTGLEQIVSAILTIANKNDEIVARIESSGGMVHSYGLAASQLARFKEKDIPLVVCVDKVAASGGYMMACIGDRILAAPFAVLGSIGVLAQLPNFNRLLKKHDIDYEQITAGEYKRTLSIFGENTEKGRAKFQDEIQDTHLLFKEFVQLNRPSLDIDSVSTGEVWFGKRAMEMGLIDEIQTSEAYLLDRSADSALYKLEYVEKRSLQERLGIAANHGVSAIVDTLLGRDREHNLLK